MEIFSFKLHKGDTESKMLLQLHSRKRLVHQAFFAALLNRILNSVGLCDIAALV